MSLRRTPSPLIFTHLRREHSPTAGLLPAPARPPQARAVGLRRAPWACCTPSYGSWRAGAFGARRDRRRALHLHTCRWNAAPMETPARPPLGSMEPQQTAQAVKLESKLLSTFATQVHCAAHSARDRAVCERPADVTRADADACALAPVRTPRHQRSEQQQERLRRAFWLHRCELRRWTERRIVKTRRKTDGSLAARWSPPMPTPDWKRLASSRDIGIFLPVESVQSFFEEHKRETRVLISKGHLPVDFVRAHTPPRTPCYLLVLASLLTHAPCLHLAAMTLLTVASHRHAAPTTRGVARAASSRCLDDQCMRLVIKLGLISSYT